MRLRLSSASGKASTLSGSGAGSARLRLAGSGSALGAACGSGRLGSGRAAAARPSIANGPPSCTRAAAAASASPLRAERPAAASSATQADSSAWACASSASRSGVAARASASHRFMHFSTAAAASANCSRPTMRPLPLSVWKPRRSRVRVSWSAGLACARAAAAAADHRQHFLRLADEDLEQLGFDRSPRPARVRAPAPGAGSAGTAAPAPARPRRPPARRARRTASNGSSRNSCSCASKRKRWRALSRFCASASVKKPSAPMFCARFSRLAPRVAASGSPAASARTAVAHVRDRARGLVLVEDGERALQLVQQRVGLAERGALGRVFVVFVDQLFDLAQAGADLAGQHGHGLALLQLARQFAAASAARSGGVSPCASASRRWPTASACWPKSSGSWRTWSRPCSTNSMASAISRLNWSLRAPATDSLAAWPSSRSSCASAGAPSFSLAAASLARARVELAVLGVGRVLGAGDAVPAFLGLEQRRLGVLQRGRVDAAVAPFQVVRRDLAFDAPGARAAGAHPSVGAAAWAMKNSASRSTASGRLVWPWAMRRSCRLTWPNSCFR